MHTAACPLKLFWDYLHSQLKEHHGAWVWAIWWRQMLAVAWRDKKKLNLLTNYLSHPHTVNKGTLSSGNVQNKSNGKKKLGKKHTTPLSIEWTYLRQQMNECMYQMLLVAIMQPSTPLIAQIPISWYYQFRHCICQHMQAQFHTILGIVLVNAWILYKEVNHKPHTKYHWFLLTLAKELAAQGGCHWRKVQHDAQQLSPMVL